MNMPIYQGDAATGLHHTSATWECAVAIGDGRIYKIKILPGFAFDGCSIPRFLWRLCGHPMEVPRIAAALAHDWLYAAHVTSRETADKIFLALCERVGIGALRRRVEYTALRMFGGAAWDSHGAADISFARVTPNPFTKSSPTNS